MNGHCNCREKSSRGEESTRYQTSNTGMKRGSSQASETKENKQFCTDFSKKVKNTSLLEKQNMRSSEKTDEWTDRHKLSSHSRMLTFKAHLENRKYLEIENYFFRIK